MKAINFLRFESRSGKGLYRVTTTPFDFDAFHPAFDQDFILKTTFERRYGGDDFQDFIFGFCDYAQILKWIPRKHLEASFKKLERLNIQCTGYSGEVVEGGYQSLIRKETARRGRKIGFKTLLKRILETT